MRLNYFPALDSSLHSRMISAGVATATGENDKLIFTFALTIAFLVGWTT
jgi:hypothetical protein